MDLNKDLDKDYIDVNEDLRDSQNSPKINETRKGYATMDPEAQGEA
jgi:hypothetical protein